MSEIRPISWQNDRLLLLDQTLLPAEETTIVVERYEDAVSAIREMRVRGAPAIGVTAAYGVYMAARDISSGDPVEFLAVLEDACAHIRAARPTAVNLGWAVDRMISVARSSGLPATYPRRSLPKPGTFTGKTRKSTAVWEISARN